MSQEYSYLKVGTQQAFNALESMVESGYANYIRIQREQISNTDNGGTVAEQQVKEWDRSYGDWVGSTAQQLQEVFMSTNYSNEFIVANNGGGLRVTTGPYNTLMQNHLGNIRKLEEFRNRIFDKGVSQITNIGTIQFNVERDFNNAPNGTITTTD